MEYLDKDNQIAKFKCDKPTYLLEQILKYSDDFFDSPYNVKRILLPGKHSDLNMKSIIFILDDIFMTFFNLYKNELNNNNQYKSIPNYVLTKMVDNDYFDRHRDSLEEDLSKSYTLILYLNDDFSGGDLSFENGISIHPKAGDFIIFPDRLPHEVTKVNGVRYTVMINMDMV